MLSLSGKSNLARKTRTSQKIAKLTPAIEESDKSMYIYNVSKMIRKDDTSLGVRQVIKSDYYLQCMVNYWYGWHFGNHPGLYTKSTVHKMPCNSSFTLILYTL